MTGYNSHRYDTTRLHENHLTTASFSPSTRRLPTPRYIQWMNQSGTLKITHKARVKFSVGDYVDSVDCDVAPMSACHLLLGRPWQFDLDATHGGRSNTYSLMHKGVFHVLKPMKENDIKAEVFVPVKKKKHVAEITSKPRTALIQEGENDVVISNTSLAASVSIDVPKSAVNHSKIISNEDMNKRENDGSVQAQILGPSIFKAVTDSRTICKVPNNSYMQIGSIADMLKAKEDNLSADVPSKYITTSTPELKVQDNNTFISHKQNELSNIPSNPRTALLQGREHDEHMAHQIISAGSHGNTIDNSIIENGNPEKISSIQFGVLPIYPNECINMEVNLSDGILYPWRKKVFVGVNLIKKKQNKYIFIGSLEVEMKKEEAKD